MNKKFTETQILKFIGKLANKWGTGHDSITKILEKVESFLEEKSEKIDFLDKVRLFISMLKDHSRQEYQIEDGALGMIIASLAYLILPTDLIPDMIPVAGFTDDAAAFMLVMKQIADEIERYQTWKRDQEDYVDIIELSVDQKNS
ncbi:MULTISPECIES: YkvA family protein [unclassified Candidatus Frackibacter]|uniref:YkvA family protein n=1 Tax=unclassified Candidatus Frackibacter TaxID=2648818 RepID=UPI000881B20F|nr:MULTISPECIES: YkvA family protein [unclassified Candidatus Frackibacter]SDC27313.1 Uncharacterized membrane protein YkvA, DUF1232 family [Candidatus Frackibacter sp. WG11]SEM54270.1 Uncharacterized membrane protein YkvA, DUF1232 family [Candidatus Frackibacter sp. WG12]SFL54122.1 Uncharacterized membrane protein YkvA, DUF1232 family [Candidatus Frackibacter sp. WG13]